MESTKELIEARGQRELYRIKMKDPSGEWQTYFSGDEFMVLDGVRRDLPGSGQITFKTETEGRAWLDGTSQDPV